MPMIAKTCVPNFTNRFDWIFSPVETIIRP
jgi:hypothetical protein